eukprot:362772-Chlamydomonas_euryale.AAC.4
MWQSTWYKATSISSIGMRSHHTATGHYRPCIQFPKLCIMATLQFRLKIRCCMQTSYLRRVLLLSVYGRIPLTANRRCYH